MTFVRDLISDLVTKRLWPIAVVLLVAIVAVPVIVSKPAPTNGQAEATARTTAAQAAKEAAQSQPVVTLAATDVKTKSRVTGLHAKDPFRRAKAAKAKTDQVTVTNGSTGGGSTSGGSTGGTDTGGTTTPTTPKAPAKTYTTYDVDLRFNEAGKAAKIRRSIARLTALPSSLDPVLVYMGLLSDGKTAVFLVNADATPQGDATCKPKKTACTYVYLQEGETEFFDLGSGTGTIQYELKVLHIDGRKTTSKSDADASYARESKAGRDVLRASTASLGYLHFSRYKGILEVTEERPASADAETEAPASGDADAAPASSDADAG